VKKNEGLVDVLAEKAEEAPADTLGHVLTVGCGAAALEVKTEELKRARKKMQPDSRVVAPPAPPSAPARTRAQYLAARARGQT